MSDKPGDTAPGEPVRWVHIRRAFDRDDRLVSETITDTRETDVPKPPEPIPGLYL
jgi:hypothetical protein